MSVGSRPGGGHQVENRAGPARDSVGDDLQCRSLSKRRPRRDKFRRGPGKYRNWATEYIQSMTNSKEHHLQGFYHPARYTHFATQSQKESSSICGGVT